MLVGLPMLGCRGRPECGEGFRQQVRSAPDSGGAPGDVRTGSQADSLDIRVELNEGGYAMGETVLMRLVTANRTDRAMKISFATDQQYDFIVRRGREIVWQWSQGKDFGRASKIQTIESGDSLVYDYRWDQTLSDGTNPPLGRYMLQGVLKTKPEIESVEAAFGIVD